MWKILVIMILLQNKDALWRQGRNNSLRDCRFSRTSPAAYSDDQSFRHIRSPKILNENFCRRADRVRRVHVAQALLPVRFCEPRAHPSRNVRPKFPFSHSAGLSRQALPLPLLLPATFLGSPLFDHGLRRGKPRNRNTEWRRTDIVHLHLVAELHAGRIAAVFPANSDLK